MAKKVSAYTTREKVIGVLIALFVVFTIGGFASASGSHTLQPPAAVQAAPVVTHKVVNEDTAIPFSKIQQNDASRSFGDNAVTTIGVNGVETKSYDVTYTDGKETTRTFKADVTTKEPVTEVTSIGVYVAPISTPTAVDTSGATAQCNDGSLSYSAHRSGTCSHHGGVSVWY